MKNVKVNLISQMWKSTRDHLLWDKVKSSCGTRKVEVVFTCGTSEKWKNIDFVGQKVFLKGKTSCGTVFSKENKLWDIYFLQKASNFTLWD